MRWVTAVALVVGALVGLVRPGRGLAAPGRPARPPFEPTDLELEDPGMLDFDFQLGVVESQGPYRLVLPDFEIDFGVLRNFELDLDGTYAIEGPAVGPFSFDHAAPDNLWLSVKVGLFDSRDAAAQSAWAVGVQVGPKFPVRSGASGIGIEGLVLLGRVVRRTRLVLNAGAFVDPNPDAVSGRPAGLEGGWNLDIGLGPVPRYTLNLDLAAVAFVSDDPPQLLAAPGLTVAVGPNLDLSLTVLVGFLPGNDQWGLLLGISPKIRIF